MTPEPNENIAQTAERLALAAIPVELGKVVALPPGYGLHKTEQFQPGPDRTRRKVKHVALSDFIDYVNQFKSQSSRIWVTGDLGGATAIIDYDSKSNPAWGEHRCSYEPKLTDSYKAWVANSGKQMTQEAFADLLEDRAFDMAEPVAAKVIELVTNFHESTSVKFKSAVVLQNGDRQFQFERTSDGAKGVLAIPHELKLHLEVLEGGPRYPVTARVRYRIQDSSLKLWFDLMHLDRLARAIRDQVVDRIQKETAIRCWAGFFES